MPDDRSPDVTQLLIRWQEDGDRAALDELLPIVYDELRKLAGAYMGRERSEHTLQPTALVHEAYQRLVDQRLPSFNSRTHFFGVVAHIMRQVLVDFARAHRSGKRGGGLRAPYSEALGVAAEVHADLLDLHEALNRLAEIDARKAQVIEMRYFAGLSREEVAEAMHLTLATVKRDLRFAEAWLHSSLTGQARSD